MGGEWLGGGGEWGVCRSVVWKTGVLRKHTGAVASWEGRSNCVPVSARSPSPPARPGRVAGWGGEE